MEIVFSTVNVQSLVCLQAMVVVNHARLIAEHMAKVGPDITEPFQYE
jgi:hypothetical protein